ncbi:MAG: hypothetical protein ACLR56_10445 [Oscillospiraceae bacterium]
MYYAYGKAAARGYKGCGNNRRAFSGNENKPFTVIDDGWSVNPCAGPWEPNESSAIWRKLPQNLKIG